jgi:TolA-binding protein
MRPKSILAIAGMALLAILGVGLGGAPPLIAERRAEVPEGDRPVDAQTYVDAMQAIRDGERRQAGQLLQRVLKKFPNSPYAPKAGLQLAALYYPVSKWEQIGSASPEAIESAQKILKLVAKKYGASLETAAALVRLGYLSMEPGNPHADLTRACARFAEAVRLYPDSRSADDAYFASGMCEILRHRPAHAAALFGQLLSEHPGSRLAPEAHYRYGLALSHLDEPDEAILALQEVRTRFPESHFAADALARITLMHRLRLPRHGVARVADGSASRGAAAGQPYRVDSGYGAITGGQPEEPPFRDISDLAIDPQGLVLVASPKSEGVFRLDTRGGVQERINHPGPDFVTPGIGLAVYISGSNQIAVNFRNWSGAELQGAGGRPPRDFGPIAIDSSGRVHLLDRRQRVVHVFDRQRRLVGTIKPASGKDGRFIDLAAGGDGGVYALDGRARTVTEIREAEAVRTIDLGALGIEEPQALAVDGLGDLFVLDKESGVVSVADPEGRRLTEIRPGRDLQSQIGDAVALAVDASGRVYLAGRKDGRIVRFQ